ncbi:MAG: hypothetical protein JWM41_552 [Gemmatimonadetes bacterium]|nr:hypothetical protein [Gemmatimonadota bacterium]
MIAFSCVIVLATYAVLIETWRRMLAAWGEHLPFGDAARIWFVSNLARYLPGLNQVFVLGALAELARRRRISPAAATGAALINTAVNIASGFVVALLAGFAALDALSGGHATLGIWIAVVLLVGLLLLPSVMPWLLGLVQRTTGRQLGLAVLPRNAIYVSLVGNLVAWTMYGLAFQYFVHGILGHGAGSIADYVAVWSAAYVIGYLALLLPAGVGVREGALVSGLTMLHLATFGPATVVAISARLWLTVLEILPALIYLARGTRPRLQDTTRRDGSNL